MRRLLVNDAMNQLGERTFWNDLREWFSMEFVGGPFPGLDETVSRYDAPGDPVTLIIRNASYFPPIDKSNHIPTVALLQDIFPDGPMREMQQQVILSSKAVVANSMWTADKYEAPLGMAQMIGSKCQVIPLPIDFSVFEPGNAMGLQQALSLPDGCVCWIGATQGSAGQIKGFDIFQQVVRLNPDIPFVLVAKDAAPDTVPPNLRCYVRLPHAELVKVIGACRVGLCTSRTESQHLAGIEMGACGLPLIVPNVGTYWGRKEWPGITVMTDAVSAYSTALRAGPNILPPSIIRDYWVKEFDRSVVKAQWSALVAEVENATPDQV